MVDNQPQTVGETVKQLNKVVADKIASKSHFSSEQEKVIAALVRKTLLDNPEILLEAQEAYEKKSQQREEKQTLAVLSSKKDELYRSSHLLLPAIPRGM